VHRSARAGLDWQGQLALAREELALSKRLGALDAVASALTDARPQWERLGQGR
jgi:hypothetical protein